MDVISTMENEALRSTVFEAFVDPNKIGGFWFSSSSKCWEIGKNIVLHYEAYDAEIEIKGIEITISENMEFKSGDKIVNIVFESYEDKTLVTTNEN